MSSLAHAVWYKDTDALIRALAAEGLGRDRGLPSRSRARTKSAASSALARELDLATTAGSDFHGTLEGRKKPGAVVGDARDARRALRARRPLLDSRAWLRPDIICPARAPNEPAEKSALRKRNFFLRVRRREGRMRMRKSWSR